MVWDATTPDGTEDASSGDNRIRELKADLENALQAQDPDAESVFPGADTSSPVYRYRGLRGATTARPAAGDYGLYVDTTRNVIQRDNGTSWDDIATLIPVGTVMVFYQAAAPTGWTKVVTQNDKALRVVSGSGGVAGGTSSFSTGAPNHNHTTASHALSVAELPPHYHTVPHDYGFAGNGEDIAGTSGPGGQTTVNSGSAGSGTAHEHGNTGDSGAWVPAYVDVIICSKD